MNGSRFFRAVFFPPPLFLWLFSPAALALLVFGFLSPGAPDALRIASYALSFWALLLICLRTPQLLRFFRRFRQENPYAVRLSSDVRLRVNLSLRFSLVFNLVYAVFQLCLGLYHRSVWFYSMAGYHFLLAGMRLMLSKHIRICTPGENMDGEWRKYRLCGALLLIMTLALSVFILYFIFQIRTFRHHEITTIAMAAYTFASLSWSVSSLFRYRKYASPAYSAAKMISLASSIVSVLTLENAMLTVFGQESGELFRQVMLGATGAAVMITLDFLAVYMMARAGKKLKKPFHTPTLQEENP